MPFEERRSFGGSKFERSTGACSDLARCFLQHFQKARRRKIEHPAFEMGSCAQIVRERARFILGQVNQKSFGENHHLGGFTAKPQKQIAPGGNIAKIKRQPLQTAGWFLVRQDFCLVTKNFFEIDLNPFQFPRQRHSIRPRIETGRQVHNRIHAAFDFLRGSSGRTNTSA